MKVFVCILSLLALASAGFLGGQEQHHAQEQVFRLIEQPAPPQPQIIKVIHQQPEPAPEVKILRIVEQPHQPEPQTFRLVVQEQHHQQQHGWEQD